MTLRATGTAGTEKAYEQARSPTLGNDTRSQEQLGGGIVFIAGPIRSGSTGGEQPWPAPR